MVLAFTAIKMETDTKVSGKTTDLMVKELYFTAMAINIQVVGNVIKWMGMELFF